MKYHLKVYYRTELMDKITGYMQVMMPDWKQRKKHLLGCQIFEINVKKPLTKEEVAKLKALKEDWMEEIKIEKVISVGGVER